MKKSLLLFCLLTVCTSCTKEVIKTKIKSPITRKETKGLSKLIAKERKTSISNISYLFEIDLRNSVKSTSFSGSSTLIFDFKKNLFPSDQLSVDFDGGEVSGLLVNGEKTDFKHNGVFISLDKNALSEGKNTLKFFFSHSFSRSGSGFYKFTDSLDGNVYVYTDFEPYDANQFAPVFDQPNLKATYSLNVKAPKSWTIITSVKEQLISDKESYKIWSFPQSKKFSTYIFSLHGGPYTEWTDRVKLKTKEIKLRLFARKSLSSFVKPDFWFKITKQGFNFFEQYFSTDFPYEKYDQVLVPDFNSGAMENVAAVTFNELYVSREGSAPRSQRRRLANVIFHEMAHMWFGNLVTMDWWNDLWLNESFATFMANTGLYYNTEFVEIWTNFNTRTKQWAYSEDRWRTTHPIETPITSTSVASASFDGITYGKGASALKQLVFLIGEDAFKNGLADYFKTYAEKNTVRKNFIDALQKHTKEDLASWTNEWLQTKGLNSLKSNINCKDSKLKSIDFKQEVISGDKKHRTHKLKLALWLSSNPSSPDETVDIRVSGRNTGWTPKKAMPCPLAVFPNWEDHAYFQTVLDQQSQVYFERNISKVDSKLMRSQFWSIMKTKFILGELHPERILPLIVKHLPSENDPDATNTILKLAAPYRGTSRLGSTVSNVFNFYSNKSKEKTDRQNLSTLLKDLINMQENEDTKKVLFNHWLTHTYEDQISEIAICLKSKCSFDLGFKLGPDRKWLMLLHLAAKRHKDAEPVLKTLSKNDKSRRADLFKTAVKASLSKDKTAMLEEALSLKSKSSLKVRSSILSGLLPAVQKKDFYAFKNQIFFKKIHKISQLPTRVQKIFATVFAPYSCGIYKDGKGLNEEEIKKSKWNYSVQKALLQALDKNERCLKIKTLVNQRES